MDPQPSEENRSRGSEPDPIPAATAKERALEAFGQWLDEELEKLVARWVHLAAPRAGRNVRR